MKMKDFLEKDYPLLQDIFCFAKEHTALFLGIWAALSTTVMFALNSLEYVYQLGYYHYGFDVPQAYLGAIHATGIPFSFVYGAVVAIFLIIYSNMAWNAYTEYRFGKFILKVAAIVTVFYLYIMGMPFFNELIARKVVLDFGIAFHFLKYILFLVVFTLVILNWFTIFSLLSESDTDKLGRIENEIKSVSNKQEKITKAKYAKTIRSNHLKKRKKILEKKKVNLVKKTKDINTHTVEEKPKKIHIVLRIAAYSFIVTYALIFIVSPFVGISQAAMNNEFEIIYLDNTSFSDRIENHADYSDINGLVKLYQYEGKVVASPCTYTDEEITIYSTVQHIIPVEDATFVHMKFLHHNIR